MNVRHERPAAPRTSPRIAALTLVVLVLVGAVTGSARAADRTAASREATASKLSPRLQAEAGLRSSRASTIAAVRAPARGPGSLVHDGDRRLIVEVRMDDVGQAPLLASAGAEVLAISGVMATIAVPVHRLADVSALRQVRYVAPVLAPIRQHLGATIEAVDPSCGTGITSEGVTQLRVDLTRSTHRVDGAGTTVGVLSDSYDALAGAGDDITDAELPGAANACGRVDPVAVLADGPVDGTDEGRAMLQIVHDIAPGADLAFATASSGELAMADRIRQLGAAGADVITDDIIYLSEPMYQDSAVGAAIIENRRDRDVIHVTSAGNSNVVVGGRDVGSYEAPALRPTVCPAAVFSVGPDYEVCHDFAADALVDATSGFTLAPGGGVVLMLGWSEPRLGVGTDLDLLVVDRSSGTVVGAGADDSTALGNPVEVVVHQNLTASPQELDVVVARWGPGQAPRFKTVMLRSSGVTAVEYDRPAGGDVVGPTMIGHAATEAAISVAAVPYDDAGSIQQYSSRGPGLRCWEASGGSGPRPPITPCRPVDVDVAATDGVANSFFGSLVGGVRRFFGTSAAAPHVAGVAALARQYAPCATATEVESAILGSAVGLAGFGTGAAGSGRTDALATIAALSTACDPAPGPVPDPATFVSVAPARYLDNRPSGETFDGGDRGGGRTGAGSRVVVQVAGRGAVPSNATAVIANLTAVNGTGVGYATAHPCLVQAPNASSVNFAAGAIEPNEVIVRLDRSGRVCIDVADADTFLILDVVGYTVAGSAYHPTDPARYVDSRPNGQTFDGAGRAVGPITPGTTIRVPVAGRGSVPLGATSAAINITATRGHASGYATVHPCLRRPPNASSVNYTVGVNRPNEVIAALDAGGAVCITVGDAAVDLIVDVVGYLTATTAYTPVGPARFADTRPNGETVDGGDRATGRVQPGTTTRIQVSGRSDVPAGTTQVIANVTVAGTEGTGYATVHPCIPQVPNASSTNYFLGTIRPNELVSRLDPTGGICITVQGAATHLIVDIAGHDG